MWYLASYAAGVATMAFLWFACRCFRGVFDALDSIERETEDRGFRYPEGPYDY